MAVNLTRPFFTNLILMSSTLNNLFWKFSERMSSQAISFVVSLILARMLAPTDYGAVAMVLIFVTLANVLIEGGFSSALIQKKDADKLDFSTVFYFSLFFSIILYAVIFIAAPYISSFYGKDYTILTSVLRIIGLQVIILGGNSVQQAYVSKHMFFRNFFWATLSGTIVSALVGLLMAYYGYGVWALVGQQLSMTTTNTIVLFFTTKKLPGLAFSFDRLKKLFNYGAKILSASLLITLFLNIRSLVIGKIYSPKDLAFFDRGQQFPNIIVTNINSSVGAVLFPKLSKEQDDRKRIKQTCRIFIRFCSFVMMPLMMGLAACAEPLVRLLLTDKWIGCVPFLQLFCIIYMFYPLHTANLQAIKALGHSGIFLRLEIIKKIIELICLLLVMNISVIAIAINMAILTTLFTFVNAFPNIKLLNYSFKEQISDMLPPIVMSTLMAICVYLIGKVPCSDILTLIIQILVGISIYTTLAFLTNNDEMYYILNLLKHRFKRNNK